MSTTPPRPAVNDAMVREVVIKALSQMNLDEEGIDAVVDVYTPHADGYQLAKELDMIHGWVVDMALVEDLDGISSAVERAHTAACAAWVKEFNIQPPYPVGTEVQQGIIEGVWEYSPAKYEVKETGCQKEGRFLLVNFEDVQPVTR